MERREIVGKNKRKNNFKILKRSEIKNFRKTKKINNNKDNNNKDNYNKRIQSRNEEYEHHKILALKKVHSSRRVKIS